MTDRKRKRAAPDLSDGPAVGRNIPETSPAAVPQKGKQQRPGPAQPKRAPKKLAEGAPTEGRPAKIKKKNHDVKQAAVAKWELLRRHQASKEERSALVAEILQQVKGKVSELAASHTASRVLQACLKHGSPVERAAIQVELLPHLLDLSKSSYGHFLVTKLIATAAKVNLPELFKALRGHMPGLLKHPCGAAVVDELYSRASAQQRNALAAEFYGKEHALFGADEAPPSLAAALAAAGGAKRRAIMQRMTIHMTPLLEKALVDAVLTHRLLAEYVAETGVSTVMDVLELLAGEPLLRCVHTRPGAWLAAVVLAHGTPKDRKKAIKAFKGHVGTMAGDEWAHIALLAALRHVDDTALLAKALLPEILAKLEAHCQHKHAHRVVMQLVAPDSTRSLPAHLSEFLAPTMRAKSNAAVPASQPGVQPEAVGEDAAVDGPVKTPMALGVSKKDNLTRRAELLGAGPDSLGGRVLALCCNEAAAFLRSPVAAEVLVAAAAGGSQGVLERAHTEGVTSLHTAILDAAQPISAACLASQPGAPGRAPEPLLQGYYSSRALRRLVIEATRGDSPEAAQRFVAALGARALQGDCKQWVGTHAEKVLAALWEASAAEVRAAMEHELCPVVGDLPAWALKFHPVRGT